MKVVLRFFVVILVFATSVHAQDFIVNNYSAEIFIKKEGYFTVSEQYDLTFRTYKHGIYRNIQLTYDLLTEKGTQEKRKIKVKNVKVPGRTFVTSGKIINDLTGELEIKIGDKDITITGPQGYTINYQVENAFLFEEKATQFYWNLKPPGWYANFESMKFNIHVPDGVSVPQDAIKLYAGYTGNTNESDDFNIDYQEGIIQISSKEDFVSRYGESVTLLVSLPPNVISETKPFWPFGARYGWTLIIASFWVGFYVVWRIHGKDDKVISATSYYPPENIDPAMAGYLIDDKSDTSDLISLLPYWGSKGYITIKEIEKKGLFQKNDTQLNKLKDLPNTAAAYERKMFTNLFRGSKAVVLISSLKDSFYTTMGEAKELLKKEAQPYYLPKSKAVKKIVSGVVVVLLFLLSAIVLYVWGLLAAGLVVFTCVILLLLNFFMIKKNTKGNEALAHLKGFRQFVKLAEAKRLGVLLNEDPHYFENTMAYALAFGYFDKWAGKFKGLDVKPPDWYHTTSNRPFSMHSFSNSFDSAMSSTRSTMVSSPSSSGSSGGGGGFSGGGFGGGGGGSW
ncbi:DUF2207 domain-containing protein [Aureisphaera sp. CAU 1614]|uniref:DUF2207 domain-containing protein n=1 Tax=Halomarinibacterium sedimenti TaxID=2857106 RepID=A0A9X1FN97_9FLAO|nr:DUF2207 domain-containing protein [Halomarinibacterium sedimenti]MBW2937566.1 DUF2207 domain-containing protein [Halomarinibacterium sedimenti]